MNQTYNTICKNEIPLNMEQLVKGNYMVKVFNDNLALTKKQLKSNILSF